MTPPIRRYRLAIVIALIGLVLTVAISKEVGEWEDRHFIAEFEQLSRDKVSAIRRSIELNIHAVDALGSFFDSSEVVKREEFRIFARKMLQDSPYIQALEWIPRVPDAERALYEERARKDGFDGFSFTEREKQGTMVEAGRRDEYFPVYYVEPYEGNEAAVGFDLASNETRLEALDLARESGQTTATARIRLVQETGGAIRFSDIQAGIQETPALRGT
ncbi:MAG: CHASE domain-containing protein [Nitrospirota bacterium]|jgi:CHASE1-domain containing sensor protein